MMYKHFPRVLVCLLSLLTFATAADGDFDLAFGNGGIATASIGNQSSDQGFGGALQPDGKMVVVGESLTDGEFSQSTINFIITRINEDGSLDTSFGRQGKASKKIGLGSRATSVVVQPNGKIVVAGYSFIDGGEAGRRRLFFVARVNSDGSFDNSFGSNGLVSTSFLDLSQDAFANAIGLQTDGKIVVCGFTYTTTVNNARSIAVARYNTDGSLDSSFGNDGRALIDEVGGRGNAIAIQPDGRIVIGGSLREVNTITDFFVLRLDPNGSLDTSFDLDGKLTTDFNNSTSTIIALDLQADGKIVAAGNFTAGAVRDIAIARYNIDGSLDQSFDDDGKVTTDIGPDTVGGMRIQTDGKIVICGQSAIPPAQVGFLAVRYNSDGSLDTSYNAVGYTVGTFPMSGARARALGIAADGRITLAGDSSTFAVAKISAIRYTAQGVLDATFDSDGIATMELGNSGDWIFEIAVQPDSKIVAAGYSFDGTFQNVTVARFLPNGSLDTSFGTEGSFRRAFSDRSGTQIDTFAKGLIVQTDGKIVVGVGSNTFFAGGGQYITFRLTPDGSLDGSFGTDGISTVEVGTNFDVPAARVLQPDGKIVAAGTSYGDVSGSSITRLNSNGMLDSTFGDNGKVITAFPNAIGIQSASLQSDGKIVVGGGGFFAARYDSNGALDTTFGVGGVAQVLFGGNTVLTALSIQSDGKVILSGFTSTDGAAARLNPDGTIDTTFDGDGKVLIPAATGTRVFLHDHTVEPDSKIVLAGSLRYGTGLSPDGDSAVFRLNSDGSLDQSFGTTGSVISSIGEGWNEFYSVLSLPGNRILAGGHSFNGLNSDFTLAMYGGNETAGFDYDGDGRSDISVFRPSTGDWYVQRSTEGFFGQNFGSAEDRLSPADYDGDGKTDIAVYRPSTGVWYITNSSNGTVTYYVFGVAEDLPTPADYDGDGKADISVFRPSSGTWYRLNSSDGSFSAAQFGASGDKPTIGDFDGDGKADIAVFRPSTGAWYQTYSSNGFLFGEQFGISTDKITHADYDGDGKTDIAIYRPSEGLWYVKNSSTTTYVPYVFGLAIDIPTPGDFDGDGKADIAVFRPSDGTWYIVNSSTGGFTISQFGQNGDQPTQNSFAN